MVESVRLHRRGPRFLLSDGGAGGFAQLDQRAAGQRLRERVQHVLRRSARVIAGQVSIDRRTIQIVSQRSDHVRLAPAGWDVSVEIVGQSAHLRKLLSVCGVIRYQCCGWRPGV